MNIGHNIGLQAPISIDMHRPGVKRVARRVRGGIKLSNAPKLIKTNVAVAVLATVAVTETPSDRDTGMFTWLGWIGLVGSLGWLVGWLVELMGQGNVTLLNRIHVTSSHQMPRDSRSSRGQEAAGRVAGALLTVPIGIGVDIVLGPTWSPRIGHIIGLQAPIPAPNKHRMGT